MNKIINNNIIEDQLCIKIRNEIFDKLYYMSNRNTTNRQLLDLLWNIVRNNLMEPVWDQILENIENK
jgi:hypothetical protein